MSDGAVQDVLPLSPLQEGIHFHAMFGGAGYVVQEILDVQGPTTPDAVQRAVATLVHRHDSLRTSIGLRRSGQPVAVVHRTVSEDHRTVDLRDATPDDAADRARELAHEDRARGFDLERPPLVRSTVVRLANDRFHLILSVHHVVVDGWSMSVLVEELATDLTGGGAAPVSAPSYRSYLEWLGTRDRLDADHAWAAALAGATPTLLDPGTQDPDTSVDHAFCSVRLPAADTDRLVRRAGELGVTLNVLCRTAWAVTLAELTNRWDVVFGTVTSGRPPELPGFDRMVGLFVTTVPVRVDVRAERTLRDVAQELWELYVRTVDHEHVGLSRIQRAAGVPAPLFDSLLAFENHPAVTPPANVGDISVREIESFERSHFPAVLMASPGPPLTLRLTYRPGVFGTRGAEPVLRRVADVLRLLADVPDTRVGEIHARSHANGGSGT